MDSFNDSHDDDLGMGDLGFDETFDDPWADPLMYAEQPVSDPKEAAKKRRRERKQQIHRDNVLQIECFLMGLTETWSFVVSRREILPALLLPEADLDKHQKLVRDRWREKTGGIAHLKQLCNRTMWNHRVPPHLQFRSRLLEAISFALEGSQPLAARIVHNLHAFLREDWGFADDSGLLTVLLRVFPLEDVCSPRVSTVTLMQSIGRGASDPKRDDELERMYHTLTLPMPMSQPAWAERIREQLNAEFPWMQPITERLLEPLRMQQRFDQPSNLLTRPVLLVGSPGCGKTRYAQRLAEISGLTHQLLSVGGMSDNKVLKGSSRQWNGSQPSFLVDLIRETASPNPVVVLDELEKTSSSKHNGSAFDTLMQLLEPQNARHFFDEFLQTTVDLSHINYIATANSVEGIPEPLRDRMMIIEVPNPTPAHLLTIAIDLWWQHWRQMGVPTPLIPAPDRELIARLIQNSNSLRQVKAIVEACLRRNEASNRLMLLH